MRDAIVRQAYEAFRIDSERTPSITLRGGNVIDSYGTPPPYDPEVDTITDPCVLICSETDAVPRSVSNRASGVAYDHLNHTDGTPEFDRC
jgi:hypothetical protein